MVKGSSELNLPVLSENETLPPEFFCRDTLKVARDLIGTKLWRRLDNGDILEGAIVELEAYTFDDPACHAFRGKTRRTDVMFGPGGFAYVYFIYGMYNCFNIVTEADGTAGAVLIRALDAPGTNGPGKLCRAWSIDRSHNGVDLMSKDSPIWLTRGVPIDDAQVEVTTRIGLSVAQERPWRFIIRDHPGVSGPRSLNGSKRSAARSDSATSSNSATRSESATIIASRNRTRKKGANGRG